MPQTTSKSKVKPGPATNSETPVEVLTLAETAAYLRLSEADVVRLVQEQGLPGREVPDGWRFLKCALQDWLRTPRRTKKGILAHIGAFKDDPTLEDMVKEIYKQRGRPMTEEG